jgi:elongation factor Ts
MMDCKRALESNDLDVAKAIDWLREKGITKAASKSSRIAAEGIALLVGDSKKALLIEVNCETDFVARSDAFVALVEDIAKTLLTADAPDMEEARQLIQPLISEATMKIGEKIDVRRYQVLKATNDQLIGSYIHHNAKSGTIVLTSGLSQTQADEMAMHITAAAPKFITTDDIPQDVIEHETKIQREIVAGDEKLKGKPEAALAKIIEGKVSKAFRDFTLSEQAYQMSDEGEKVSVFLDKVHGKVHEFVHYIVGEGIEKRADNFAEEVMAQIK